MGVFVHNQMSADPKAHTRNQVALPLEKKTIFNPMDHQHTSANDYCFDCRLYTRASFTITCYFDFINIYCNTSFLVNNAIPLMSNVNI